MEAVAELTIGLGKLERVVGPVPNIVLLLCLTQMNWARQWYNKRTAVVSYVEFVSVAPRIRRHFVWNNV